MRARDLLRSPLRWPSHDSGWRREEETLAAGRLPPHLRSALSPLEVRPPPSPSHAASPLRSLPGGYESIPARGDQVGTRKQWQMVLGLQWQVFSNKIMHWQLGCIFFGGWGKLAPILSVPPPTSTKIKTDLVMVIVLTTKQDFPLPIILVENSGRCKTNEHGEKQSDPFLPIVKWDGKPVGDGKCYLYSS
uniref:Uncharacterized protein n=1 Tax=Oryza nivara TaxID=4536 RepID=A0A0E0IRD3_ORYNI